MKIAIISDIHANLAALESFPERDCDQILCMGDLVDYGPKPKEVLHWVQKHTTVCVRGNHDHAVGYRTDPHCSVPYHRLAAATMRYTLDVLFPEECKYLRELPIQRELTFDKTKFYLVHATPTDPLFGYCDAMSDRWENELDWITADVILVGHTHMPFVRQLGTKTIVNPGSIGQPKTDSPEACYAVWEDGMVTLKRYSYSVEKTVSAILEMPVRSDIRDMLIYALRTGTRTLPIEVIHTRTQ